MNPFGSIEFYSQLIEQPVHQPVLDPRTIDMASNIG